MSGAAQDCDAPVASVIICARDRREALARALEALERQSLACFETVVVDDGSRDGTAELLRDRWLPRAQPGRRRIALHEAVSIGPGAARNAGAAVARSPLLVFLDSDCVPEARWLECLLAPFADETIGAVGGAEVDDPAEPIVARALNFAMTSRLTTGGIRGASGARAGRYRPRTFSMAVRRELLEEIGGFSDLRQGEDIDFAVRVEQCGVRAVFAADARVRHARRRSVASACRQGFSMGRARTTLMRRDPAHVELVYLAPALLVAAAAALLTTACLAPGARPLAAACAAVGVLYLGLVGIVAAVRLGRPAFAVWTPLVFLAQQLSYGVGFWLGLLRPPRDARAA